MPGINAGFALLSQQFMFMAGVAYAVAFGAYAWDLVAYSKLMRRGLALESAAAADSVAAARLVGVGSAGSIGQDLGAGPEDRGVRPSSKVHAGSDGITAGDSMKYGPEKRRAARVAVALTVLAAVVHGLAVVFRGIGAGRAPWGNMYEFCTTGGFTVTLIFLLVLTRRDLRFLGTFIIGLVLIMITYASLEAWTPAGHLVPALQSYWLIIHVSIAVMSSALFTMTFAMSVLQLFQSRREASLASGKRDKALVMRLVPNALSLENMSYRINGIAFVGWTLTLMFGSIWAEKAWGRFWGWDTKEVWTFVIWVVYAGYLHARATRGWTGTRAAWLSIAGYLCVVFNFTIVNVFFSGLHSYAGVGS
ncbi:cytochrome c-type biogenesis protein CcsB [Arthrobacter silviterrae]|uniref:C-type cytochrome biogenesis protein CcsB n=1 Tax=Arthrobacter silviterrae TaxID=2026658 RepID=A0ABX0DGV5_9MICC|nr:MULTISPECIES: c-type cytochrome biogenesis protein CcsB [Arthrobacter]MCU6478884.1 c-type cytochrome biogenesis protein CcsB [Arthrobacter sp. A2-55]MDQ0277854.1 cytochrome c-type biogenesis protein CcsB [Arthrobacter silviterrae]NGN83780.1 c-type cytochrome biogenesis protein CcsB [Arthrobacter silviterrae]